MRGESKRNVIRLMVENRHGVLDPFVIILASTFLRNQYIFERSLKHVHSIRICAHCVGIVDLTL